jgi:predicted RNA-binding Zn ribbon-like protein
MAEERTRAGFYFVGERVCLDFVNTEAVENGVAVDLLGGFDALVAWCVAARVVDAEPAKRLRADWSGTREGERAFARAIQLRTALRGMAERLAAGRPASRALLDAINEVLRTRAGHVELVPTKDGYEKRFRPDFSDPAHVLVPIAESAADLLSDGDPHLIRKCQNPRCVLYFYDTTKNHARRWCSMTACGNRAKVAAHYRRARPGQA